MLHRIIRTLVLTSLLTTLNLATPVTALGNQPARISSYDFGRAISTLYRAFYGTGKLLETCILIQQQYPLTLKLPQNDMNRYAQIMDKNERIVDDYEKAHRAYLNRNKHIERLLRAAIARHIQPEDAKMAVLIGNHLTEKLKKIVELDVSRIFLANGLTAGRCKTFVTQVKKGEWDINNRYAKTISMIKR
jgi:hypothetical protein